MAKVSPKMIIGVIVLLVIGGLIGATISQEQGTLEENTYRKSFSTQKMTIASRDSVGLEEIFGISGKVIDVYSIDYYTFDESLVKYECVTYNVADLGKTHYIYNWCNTIVEVSVTADVLIKK